ncbi:MAG: BirA family transcriptional regulator, biotin operon repressor / biotin---[acetyl-CoA-carboxylase] ligase [Desulfobacteraceae bacterium Eth-SRB2]|nr:MAG: BirA family transcriptional regulator, biotin operon repressor / biotin---[acetyl-CoA-carboxylase] ligase [Desulfobacteraceae bacterium Eth-SRB2]
MKGQILKILRAENGVVSGETLSSHLGISRVSIWKHIKKLREFGYNVQATPKGYRLINDPDILYPWEFGDRELNIHYFDEVTSTMDVAGNLARNDSPHFTVVIAGRQSKGRGRLKRTWLSSEGGLYFTIILRPQIPPAFISRVNFAASMILARTLRNMFHIDARVKWPNDILVNERKVAGLLSEMEAETDMVKFINIGMGVNVNNNPTPREPMAVSLKKIIGRNILRKQLLAGFLDEFENRLNKDTLDNVISEWKSYSLTMGRPVKIVTTHDEFKGIAVDVDNTGALMLKLADGSIKKIIYGDCFHT